MTEPECQQTHQELVTMLQDFQLGWVVKKAESQMQQGKMADVQLLDASFKAGSQAGLTDSETHTGQEQLLLLIDAVERFVVGAIEIEGALVDFLSEETERLQSPVALSFEADSVPALTSEDEGLEGRRSAIAELRQILQALRQEATSDVD
jgi:hypothetical protein